MLNSRKYDIITVVIGIWGISKYIMKGRINKMMIPQHVHEIARKIQDELETQKEQYPRDDETRDSLRKIKKLREKLKDSSLKDATYLSVMVLFQQIIETSYPLSAFALDRVYTRVEIAPDLVFAITQAYDSHPEMREELDLLQEFLQDVPNANLGTTDSFAKYKYFKLVRSEEEWENTIKHGGENLGKNLNNYGELQYLKIAYVTSYSNFNHFSYLIKEQLIKCGEYAKIMKAFQEWFLIGATGTFYIYIPE